MIFSYSYFPLIFCSVFSICRLIFRFKHTHKLLFLYNDTLLLSVVLLNIVSFVTFLAENINEFTSCDQSEFACSDQNNTCLDRSAVCDGITDCPNGKDEHDSICKCTSDQVSFICCQKSSIQVPSESNLLKKMSVYAKNVNLLILFVYSLQRRLFTRNFAFKTMKHK